MGTSLSLSLESRAVAAVVDAGSCSSITRNGRHGGERYTAGRECSTEVREEYVDDTAVACILPSAAGPTVEVLRADLAFGADRGTSPRTEATPACWRERRRRGEPAGAVCIVRAIVGCWNQDQVVRPSIQAVRGVQLCWSGGKMYRCQEHAIYMADELHILGAVDLVLDVGRPSLFQAGRHSYGPTSLSIHIFTFCHNSVAMSHISSDRRYSPSSC